MDVKSYELSEVSAASARTHRVPATDLLKEINHAAGRA